MWWTLGKRLLQVYGVLWMTAVGGLVGANLLAIIAMMFFVSENKSTEVAPWMTAGWWIGTALAFIGAITGNLKFIQGTSLTNGRELSLDDRRPGESSTKDEATEASSADSESPSPASSGVMAHMLGGGLAGGICGLLLGASLLVFWFSLAYSPFAPQTVSSAVTVEREQAPESTRPRNVFRSRSPILLYLCLAPAAIGIIAGASAFGVIGIRYRGAKPKRCSEKNE